MKNYFVLALIFSALVPCAAQTLVTDVSATSTLTESAGYSYKAANVLDNDPSTAWVEGVSGSGIGESIEFWYRWSVSSRGILIRSGFFDERYWKANNRIKTVEIRFRGGSVVAELEDRMVDHYVTFETRILYSCINST